jgi:hypothetical protein
LAAIVALTVTGPARPASADEIDDTIRAVDRAYIVFDAFVERDLWGMSPEEAQQRTASAAEAIRDRGQDLNRLAEEASDEELAELTAGLGAGFHELAAGVALYGNAAAAGDEDGFNAAADSIGAVLDRLDAQTIAYDEYLAAHPLASGDIVWFIWTGLLALAVLCLLFAVFLTVKNRKSPYRTPQVLSARRDLLISALVFVAGAAIPAVQYWRTEAGGEYQVFWYPLAVGGICFIVGVPRYFSRARKAKRLATGGAPPAVAPGYGPPPGYAPAPGYGPPPAYSGAPGYGSPPGYSAAPGYGAPPQHGAPPQYGAPTNPPDQLQGAAALSQPVTAPLNPDQSAAPAPPNPNQPY